MNRAGQEPEGRQEPKGRQEPEGRREPKGSDSTQEPEAPDSTTVLLARFTGHGLTIAAATGLFLLAGWWVDGRLGTTPLLTILGALIGAGAGFYSLIQHLLLRPRALEAGKGGASAAGNTESTGKSGNTGKTGNTGGPGTPPGSGPGAGNG
jgi:hypothetical protein